MSTVARPPYFDSSSSHKNFAICTKNRKKNKNKLEYLLRITDAHKVFIYKFALKFRNHILNILH